MPFGHRSPLEIVALPGAMLAYKYSQFRQRRREAASRRVTERELSALHHKIVSVNRIITLHLFVAFRAIHFFVVVLSSTQTEWAYCLQFHFHLVIYFIVHLTSIFHFVCCSIERPPKRVGKTHFRKQCFAVCCMWTSVGSSKCFQISNKFATFPSPFDIFANLFNSQLRRRSRSIASVIDGRIFVPIKRNSIVDFTRAKSFQFIIFQFSALEMKTTQMPFHLISLSLAPIMFVYFQ